MCRSSVIRHSARPLLYIFSLCYEAAPNTVYTLITTAPAPASADGDLHHVVLVMHEARLGVGREAEEVVDLLLREALAVRREQVAQLVRLDVALVVRVECPEPG